VSRPVVIAAGGTGGHMFPAMALARELARRGRPAILVCDRRGARYLGAGLEHRLVSSASLSGSPWRRLAGLARLAFGFFQSLLLLRRQRPIAVAAFGGYASVPVALAARLLRIPLLVHEQNAVLGRANRLIARRAGRLALTFRETSGASIVPQARRVLTGNPVRAEIAALQAEPYAPPGRNDPLRVLVIGGSQGARVLSDVVPEAVRLLPARLRARLQLTQQCRPEDLERVATAYEELRFRAELRPFFEDLPERLAHAHLVISRSGASSVAELLVLGRPAVLVPFRLAADDHQRANAKVVADAGAAWLMGEAEIDPDRLAALLAQVIEEPGQLAEMAARSRGLGRPGAAGALADALASLAPSTARVMEALA
jgi:UDP-N-acetylglucosamine--N-acetylmuramyl-(pentapeptide) pyrophosphoryl-undecaprenol N-acetylglucosamine transferase